MSKSNVATGPGKPVVPPEKPAGKRFAKKPFPLYAHKNGKWAKKIGGKFHYFGRWGRIEKGEMVLLPYRESWEAALAQYEAEREDREAGRTPGTRKEGVLRIGGDGDPSDDQTSLFALFLTAKTDALNAGEIQRRTYDEYKATMLLLAAQFGKMRQVEDLTADDFAALKRTIDKRWGVVRRSNEIQKIRTVFKFAYEMGKIKNPMRYGPQFKKPGRKQLTEAKNAAEEKFLEASDCRKLIDAAQAPLKAMILLGLNCGFGNHDCATLPLSALDLEKGFITYPRPKTAVKRRCPLWPETVTALQDALAARPSPKDPADAGLVFLTAQRKPWLSGGIANPVSVSTRKLMATVGIKVAADSEDDDDAKGKGIGHYTLRRVFRTVADGAKDQVAANAIMGHSDPSMAGVYRVRIDDSRLIAVTDHVRAWLYADATDGGER